MGHVGPAHMSSHFPAAQMPTPPRARRHEQNDDLAFVPLAPAALLPTSIPAAVVLDHQQQAAELEEPAMPAEPVAPEGVDASNVMLCDLGSKALLVEDLENALRLWTRPAVLIATRNSLDRLPVNVPGTILYLDLSWNR